MSLHVVAAYKDFAAKHTAVSSAETQMIMSEFLDNPQCFPCSQTETWDITVFVILSKRLEESYSIRKFYV